MKRTSDRWTTMALLAVVLALTPMSRGQDDGLSLDDAMRRLPAYTFEESRLPLTVIERAATASLDDEAARHRLERRLVGVLENDRATRESRAFACRQLALVGSAAAVPALAARLDDPALSHMARYALQVIPGPESTRALLDSLGRVGPDRAIGVVNTIGARGDAEALEAVAALRSRSRSGALLTAEARALGRLGGHRACDRLAQMLDELQDRPDLQRQALDGLVVALLSAEWLTDDAEAIEAWTTLLLRYADALPDKTLARQYRFTALGVLSHLDAAAAVDPIVASFMQRDEASRGAAARLVMDAAPGATAAYAARLPALTPYAQWRLVEALAARGDPAAADAVAALASSEDRAVRMAVLRALGDLGSARDVPRLLEHATAGETDAEESLERLSGSDIDQAIANAAAGAAPATQIVIARTLGARGARDQAPALRQLAGAPHTPPVRTRAMLALADFAPPEVTPAALAGAMAVAAGPEEKRWVLWAIEAHADYGLLSLSTEWLDDLGVGRDAARASIALARTADADHVDEAISVIERIVAAYPDDTEIRSLAGNAISHVDRREGFITAWAIAGPYMREDVDGAGLFDVAFAPEPRGEIEIVSWKAVPDTALRDPGVVDIQKLLGGGNRVAYLRTLLHSPRQQVVRLELGSDDGLKAWLNGALVHSANVMRGLTPGSDVVTVRLEAGVNPLLLKVTQGGGDWGGCCRLRTPEGFRIDGIEATRPD